MSRVWFVLMAVLVVGLAGGGLTAKQPNFLFLICDSMVSNIIREGVVVEEEGEFIVGERERVWK